MSLPNYEPELDQVQEARLVEATEMVKAICIDLDADGFEPEEIAAWLLSQAYLVMATHYPPGAVFDWANEGVRKMIATTADETFNKKLQ